VSGPISGLDHVQVAAPAGCEEAARRFYGSLLGLEEIEKPPVLAARGGVWFRVGVQELHVGVADPFGPAVKAHPALRVVSRAALVQLAARLEEHDIAVIWPDGEEIPGSLRCYVHDPWGNRIELLA
jgi:catechol 2,3-dioxygenase-like lactoylglutathione lyase family enzyme